MSGGAGPVRGADAVRGAGPVRGADAVRGAGAVRAESAGGGGGVDSAGGVEIALSVRDLSVRFGGLKALSDVSLDVRAGEVHGLLGPNGSGKTTLLNAASGFVRCTGSIEMHGVSLLGHPAHRRARLGLLRTFQNPKLVRELTVGDLLRMGEHVRGMRPWWQVALSPVADRRARLQGTDRALAALDLLQLDRDLLSAQVSELSQGVLKMVDIARALMAEPRVLLLDEPSSGMSEEEIVQLRGRLAALTGRGTTLVLVEHNLNLVRSVCHSVTVLNLGHEICSGPTAEMLARQDVTDAFLGTSGG